MPIEQFSASKQFRSQAEKSLFRLVNLLTIEYYTELSQLL